LNGPLYAVVGVIAAFLLILTAISLYFANKVINIRVSSDRAILDHMREMGEVSGIGWYEQLEKEAFYIKSPFGYSLYAEYIPVKGPSAGTVVFSHGVTVSHLTSVKYARLFYDIGYNCLIYDHRRHGSSGGRHTSYGHYEKHDLKAVVDWLEENKGFKGRLGIHGESMGSAITLLYAGMEDKADFYVVDCPYTRIRDQLLYRLKVEYGTLLLPIMGMVRHIIRLWAGFDINDVDCLEAVKNIEKPVLFIHGDADDYVPTAMGIALHEAKPEPKAVCLVPGAGHARALAADPEGYRKALVDFLEQYVTQEPGRAAT